MNTFAEILKAEKALNTIDSQSNGDLFWSQHAAFKAGLVDFLRNVDFSGLTGKQVLKLCSLVSSYRPVEPFQFLQRCSKLIENQ